MKNTDKCLHCRFFELEAGEEVHEFSIGICRRKSPHIDGEGSAMWPFLVADDWCGEHQPKQDS